MKNSKNSVEEIKRRTDLVKLIEDSGVLLSGSSSTLKGICPLHPDIEPSLRVQVWKQWWWCYACQTGGDAISWIMKTRNCDFHTALRTLDGGNLSISVYRNVSPTKKPSSPFIPDLVVEKFHSDLMRSDKTVEWISNKRSWSREVITKYKIGYDTNSQRFSIPVKHPILDEWTDIRMYNILKKPSYPKMSPYSSGRECMPLIFDEDDDKSYIILCEGEPDGLAAASCGLNAATNGCGVNAAPVVWKEWYGLIEPFADIYICFDLDAAGKEGAEKLKQVLPSAEILTLPEELGEKGDITDAIQKYGKTQFKDWVLNYGNARRLESFEGEADREGNG